MRHSCSRGFFPTKKRVEYRVYILRNPKGRLYIGLRENVTHRVEQHHSGVSTWTRARGPWKLVWTSGPLSLGEARKLESLLKRQKGGVNFFHITGLPRNKG